MAEPFEDLLRDLAPRVPAALLRRHGQFDACETASLPEQRYLTRRAAELRPPG